MARGKGKGRGLSLSGQGRGSGECSTSVESSSRASHDMQFPAASAVLGTCTRRKGENQTAKHCDSEDLTHDNYDEDKRKVSPDGTVAEKPDLEAYCGGAWWDIEILEKKRDEYLVHYVAFTDRDNQWVPFGHLRMRTRASLRADCWGIHPGIDVCVMTRHPHAEGKFSAWYDARVMDIERDAHTPRSCKCLFQIALYTIPKDLPCDRMLLPRCQSPVLLKGISLMREARSMTFQEVVAASLPTVTNIPRVWAQDGKHWYSSFYNYGSTSRDRSFSFESRVAGGSICPSLFEGLHADRPPVLKFAQLKPHASFLEEEGMENPTSLSPDGKDEGGVGRLPVHSFPNAVPSGRDEGRPFPVVSGSEAQPIVLDMDDEPDAVAVFEKLWRPDSDLMNLDKFSGDERKIYPEGSEYVREAPSPTPSSGTRRKSGEELDNFVLSDLRFSIVRGQSPPKPISVTLDVSLPVPCSQAIPLDPLSTVPIVELTTSSVNSLGDYMAFIEEGDTAWDFSTPETVPYVERATLSEDCDEVGLEDQIANRKPNFSGNHFASSKRHRSSNDQVSKRLRVNNQSVRSTLKSPFRTEVQSKGRLETKSPSRAERHRCEEVGLKNREKVQSRVHASEKLETVGMALARSSVQGGKKMVFVGEDTPGNFATLGTVPSLDPATLSEDSDVEGLEVQREPNYTGNHFAPPERHPSSNDQNNKRHNQSVRSTLKFPFPIETQSKGRLKMKPSSRARRFEEVHLKEAMKVQSGVHASEKLGAVDVALARSPVQGCKNLDVNERMTMTMEEFADDLVAQLENESPFVRDLLARSKEGYKTGLSIQPCLSKPKRPRKVGLDAGLTNVAKAITYAELFESVEPVHFDSLLEEKGPTEGLGLSPSWNPLMESVAPALSLQEVQDDPLADIWEDLRVAQESFNKVNGGLEAKAEDSLKLIGEREISGEIKCQEHVVTFDEEVGRVCKVCGIVVMEIENMWKRDNAKKIGVTKEDNDDNDEDDLGLFNQDGLAFWDSDDDNQSQQNSIEGGSNFELIPELAKHMQSHQKHGFQFLWRNLAGQDANGNPCFPPRKPGGCVLSHAPGTGKTFLIISFLQSYMKKYPKCRPVIVAPKIMLQPWEKEFRKWNVDIPVYNFNKAGDQGRAMFQEHEKAGVIQLNNGGRSKKQLPVVFYREAMLWQWINTPSVLVISYPMFSLITSQTSALADARNLRVRMLLLERPHILVLDEGHFARNCRAQVRKQLMAVKTPLRIMLSGTLFQNNFEELYTSLNLVRSGFVKTYAQAAGLKFNIQQETEPQADEENDHCATEWKEKADKAAEAQAKKLFIEEIGNKIDKGQNTPESLAQGLEQLSRLTSPFVHHYKGGVLRNLPALRDFAIMLQPTALQQKMVQTVSRRLLDKTMLERECLLSLICIHPTLCLEHNVGKTLTDLLPPEEMSQVFSNRDPAVGVKTRFVINLLKLLRHGEEKILIFCQNIDPLILLEEMLNKQFDWVREQEILRLDGKVNQDERQSIIERFNEPSGRIRVLLASTKACGEGITLTGASRVVFMDVLWNPAVIRQAIHRAFRIGQKKIVHVYRLVATGTEEESKYQRMVWKDWKSQAIFYASEEKENKADKNNVQHCFWEIKKQSKDSLLNELKRQDEELHPQAFKHIFRHGGLFDDDYTGDPDAKGTDATDWLRRIEDNASYDIDEDYSGDNDDFEIEED